VFVGGVGVVHVFLTDSAVELCTVNANNAPRSSASLLWMQGMTISRNGKVLLVDQGGKDISVFAVHDASADHLNSGSSSVADWQHIMRNRASPLTWKRICHDTVNKAAVKWGDMACSGFLGEYFCAITTNRDIQQLYIFSTSDGFFNPPHEDSAKGTVISSCRRCVWHPWRPIIVTVFGGKIAIWKSPASQDDTMSGDAAWLAFAPGFTLLASDNVVYKERLDEFDPQVIEMEKEKYLNAYNNECVDVLSKPRNDCMVEEDSGEDEPSVRLAPRCVTRGIGYFIRATVPTVNVFL